MSSNILAVSASLKYASIALQRDNLVEFYEIADDIPTYLVQSISDFLNDHNLAYKDLDRVIVASGPGSFTGIRTVISFAKAIQSTTDCNVVCVNYFDVLRTLYPTIDAGIMIINSENNNEFYYMLRNNDASVGYLHTTDVFDVEYSTVIYEPNEQIKSRLKCKYANICDNLRSADNLLLLSEEGSEHLKPYYIKPSYVHNTNCAKR